MYKDLIKSELDKICASLTKEIPKYTVEHPVEEKFGDYATNIAMVMAGIMKKPPTAVAKEIAAKFPKLEFIERVEIEHPGFINFHLSKNALINQLQLILQQGENYGAHDLGKGKKVVLEHSAVNPNKALHIGHLRCACLGNACENMLEFLGYDVEVQYYVDDTGVQVAVSALGALDLDIEPETNEKFDHFAGRAYVEAMKKLENNKKLEKRRDAIIHELDKQEGDQLKFIKEFVSQVFKQNLKTIESFDIDYDVLVWESDIILSKFWSKAFEILKHCPDFYQVKAGENKGCWVLKGAADSQSNEESDHDKIIVKSNGVVTYTGKDIAYHLWKFNLLGLDFKYKKFPTDTQKKSLFTTAQDGKSMQKFGHADLVVNFIDLRQSYPQKVVKKSLCILGYHKESSNLRHVAYGIVSLSPRTAKALGVELKEGKTQYAMSGRSGTFVLVDDLLTLVKNKLKIKHRDAPQPDKIAAAAIKYLMLLQNPSNDIVFSYDKALDIYGNTGPYLQYAYTRGRSVLNKAAKMKKPVMFSEKFLDLHLSGEETRLLKWLIYFPETIIQAAGSYAPNLLCLYIYELASRFNTFYNKRPILNSKKGPLSSQFRVSLTGAVAQILGNGLKLLGIERLEKM
jgi:arginyl-tRNA synthetase